MPTTLSETNSSPGGPRPQDVVRQIECPMLVLWGKEEDLLTPFDNPVSDFLKTWSGPPFSHLQVPSIHSPILFYRPSESRPLSASVLHHLPDDFELDQCGEWALFADPQDRDQRVILATPCRVEREMLPIRHSLPSMGLLFLSPSLNAHLSTHSENHSSVAFVRREARQTGPCSRSRRANGDSRLVASHFRILSDSFCMLYIASESARLLVSAH